MNASTEPDAYQERILVLAPFGKDAPAVAQMLERAGIACQICRDLYDLCEELDHGAGAALIADEALGDGQCLIAWLDKQPPWSDLPVLIATTPASRSPTGLGHWRSAQRLGNVVLLERPLRSATLISAVQSALRARRRQYQVRDHLREREAVAAELRRLNETLEQRVHDRTRALAEAHQQIVAESESRKQVEEVLRHAQKMEAVGQLTGGVAHDFNNLLTAVLGNLEFIGMRHFDEPTQRLVASAIRAAERGARLTQQLLAFARKQHLEPKPINVNDVIAGLGELLTRTIGTTIRVERLLDEQLWPSLVDPNQLELVLLNLAINARDAMPLGGQLTIETNNVIANDPQRPPNLPPGDLVRVAVSDTGTGMSEEVLARAFEPFFTTKEIGRGSGLGLSQVYGVAKQSGGDVRIRSRLGKGTTVEVYLPRARIAAPAPAAAAPNLGDFPRGHATVLVVDDDTDVRDFISAGLRSLGYRTIEAASGRAALDLLERQERIDCLLVDYAMPAMTGVELARRVRHKRPRLPILFTTGYVDTHALDGQLQGAPLLRKPFKLAELAEKMHAILHGGHDVGPSTLSVCAPARPHAVPSGNDCGCMEAEPSADDGRDNRS